eukprot:15160900-Alexandrium_andersonii.AAC.1
MTPRIERLDSPAEIRVLLASHPVRASDSHCWLPVGVPPAFAGRSPTHCRGSVSLPPCQRCPRRAVPPDPPSGSEPTLSQAGSSGADSA